MPDCISKFLPANYDTRRPVAVIAGRQLYPVLTIAALRAAGVPVRLIAFEGETRDDVYASFPEKERAMVKVGQLGKMLKALKELEAGYVIMVGQITPGRLFRDLHPDLKAIRVLAGLKERNATTIFGAICKEINAIGLELLDARAFLDSQLVCPGVMTGGRLKDDAPYIEHGIKIAKASAALDIGQGVVVRKGTVLAVEAFEGTDEMLSRANKYKTDRLIFVKTSKPGQDFRYDVPVFGMKTLETMKASGIGLACLESERTLILEKEKVLQQARDWKLQIYGY
ncbi:MAG: UDP-2,3-diacylglucosamine diphosphatase LpxI [Verrucomicrobiota bacterium]|nr:UDP-2,3-diacylglucosamine diphosphatase LpxI [Verrucomicrobiota bacterium]